jgi:hypothetical protein
MRSGLQFGSGNTIIHGAETEKEVNYELSYVHRKKNFVLFAGILALFAPMHRQLAKGGAIGKNRYAVAKRKAGTPPAPIETGDPNYHVVNVSDLALHAPGLSAKTATEAQQMAEQLVLANPNLKGKIQVAATHELN